MEEATMTRSAIPMLVLVALLVVTGCGDDGATGNDNQNENQNQPTEGVCGDGTVDLGEVCDEGAANSDNEPDTCRTSCRLPWCGDGVMDADEECDEGGANSDIIPSACRRDCRLAYCGDGVLETTEECDDQNVDAGDGCSADCEVEERYQCSSSPSECICADFRSGPTCGQCRVYVDVAADPAAADGTSWPTAFSDVKQGLQAAYEAGAPCEVWVAQGRYVIFETSASDALRLRSGIGLYGGFDTTETTREQRDWQANPTLLDGTLGLMGVSTNHVVTAMSTEDATLDGFVVTRGVALGGSLDSMGAGLLAMDSRLEVANCVFVQNVAETSGGGLMLYASQVTLRNSILSTNIAGRTGANASTGAGLTAYESDLWVADSYFVGNLTADGLGGGGAYLVSSTADFRNVVFAGNGVDGGLTLWRENVGGAIKLESESTVTLRHATLVDNHAWQGGAIAVDRTSSVALTSSLLFGNVASSGTDPAVRVLFPGAFSLDYCRVTADLTCPTCTNADPVFAPVPPVVGNIQSLSYDEETGLTEVEIDNVDWIPGELTGVYVSVPGAPTWLNIVDNTTNTVRLWGDLTTTLTMGISYVGHVLQLDSSSPCIDAAHGLEVPPLDVEGSPRWDDVTVTDAYDCAGQPDCFSYADMGAFEYHP
jgi:cysteine-rich repeat protein